MTARVFIGAWRSARPADIGQDAVEIDVAHQTVRRGLAAVYLPRRPFRVAACILAAAPLLATYEALELSLWGDREDGGPLWVQHDLHVRLHRIRRSLAPLGLTFRTTWGMGITAEVADAMPSSLSAGGNRPPRPCEGSSTLDFGRANAAAFPDPTAGAVRP